MSLTNASFISGLPRRRAGGLSIARDDVTSDDGDRPTARRPDLVKGVATRGSTACRWLLQDTGVVMLPA